MHMFSSEQNVLGGFAFIGEGIPVALGAAFQTAYKRRALGDDSADQVRSVISHMYTYVSAALKVVCNSTTGHVRFLWRWNLQCGPVL